MRMLTQTYTFVSFIDDFDPEDEEHVDGAIDELKTIIKALDEQGQYLGKLNAEFAEYMMNPDPEGD